MILSAGTLRGVPVAVRAHSAASAGFDAIAIHHSDLQLGLPDPAGFPVAEVGFLHRWAATDAAEERETLVELAVRAGARRLTAGIWPVSDPSSLPDAFAELCAAALRAGGLEVALEPFPFGGLPTPAAAAALIEAARAPNARVLLDAWHWHRAGTPWADLARLAPGLVACLQLSDAAAVPEADAGEESRHGRLLPGHGVIDFPGLFAALDAAAQAPEVAVEVLSDALDREPPQRRAELAFASADSLLAAAGWRRRERS